MEFDSGSIPLMLKSAASNMLLAVLDKIDGQKDIIICDQLISVIDLICSFKEMKSIGVNKIYKLDNVTAVNSKKLCFILKSTINDVKKACNWVNMFQNKEMNELQYWITFVPQRSFDCEKYLEQEGLYSYFSLLEFPLGFIPVDRDLFSLELNDSYQDYLLLGDYHFLNNIVQSLCQFQKLVGFSNLIFSKGRASEFICDNLQKTSALSGLVNQANVNDHMIDLIVFDREEDYASLFLSQLNYSGILDETFSIKCGKVELDNELIKDTPGATKHQLFGSDRIFSDVQDMSFSSVCISLKEKGQKLRQKYHERQSMSLNEMKEFLTKDLRNIQSEHKALFLHINICETIMERKKSYKFSEQLKIEQNLIEGIESRVSLNLIEDGIVRLFPKEIMLRLICLYSVCYSGISNKDLHNLIKLFSQSYGYQSILTFFNLKKIGIIFETSNQFNFVTSSSTPKLGSYQNSSSITTFPSESIKKFRHITKKFNLIPLLDTECYNVRVPSDCGYVFGGAYYPYVCKIVNTFFDLKAVSQIDEWCKQTLCKLQPSLIPNKHNGRNLGVKSNRIQVVLFVGGVTYAEVSALRFLSQQKGIPILIMTTSITNGNTFLETISTRSF